MALRVKDVDVGGQKVRIANLQLRPLREYREALDAITAKKADAPHVDEATKSVVLASLARAGEKLTRDDLEQFDSEDLLELWQQVMAWTRGPDAKPDDVMAAAEKPSDPPPSP